MTVFDSLLTGKNSREAARPVILDPATGWYQPWYFDLRLHEEFERSSRHNLPMSVICVELDTGVDLQPIREKLAEASLLRSTDIPCQLDTALLVICLPHTDASGAAVVMERLVELLSEFQPKLGRATFPTHGDDVEVILARAFHRAHYGPL